jgi:hypothetical protein
VVQRDHGRHTSPNTIVRTSSSHQAKHTATQVASDRQVGAPMGKNPGARNGRLVFRQLAALTHVVGLHVQLSLLDPGTAAWMSPLGFLILFSGLCTIGAE